MRLSNSLGLSSVIPAQEFTTSNFILPVNSAGYVSPSLSIRPLRVSRGEDSTPAGDFPPDSRIAARACSTQMQSRGRIAIRGCEPCGSPYSSRIAISREFDRSKEEMLVTPDCCDCWYLIGPRNRRYCALEMCYVTFTNYSSREISICDLRDFVSRESLWYRIEKLLNPPRRKTTCFKVAWSLYTNNFGGNILPFGNSRCSHRSLRKVAESRDFVWSNVRSSAPVLKQAYDRVYFSDTRTTINRR